MNKLRDWLSLAFAYVRLNFRAHLEYRGAFISQVAAMIINDTFWVIFWTLFFSRFPVLRGWDVKDVLTIWGIAASGFGIAAAICGNAMALPTLVVRGQLDAWMLYPRALLPHMILGRMIPSAVGDALFGYVVYVAFVHPDWQHFLLFVLFSTSAAVLFVGFFIFSGSLSFFMGNAENVAEQWRNSLVTFSTYPSTLFDGAVKVLLYTLVPAGFVTYLPVKALHSMAWQDSLFALAGSAAILFAGCAFFYAGLRRYESGSLMELRG
ncbi:MAG TPA: ABC-2 family transporter protein [Planktothrix sp.]